jgi:hypothetical protein
MCLQVAVVLERWGLLGKGSSGSGDPVGDHVGETKVENASSLMGSCLAFETPEVRGSGGLMLSFSNRVTPKGLCKLKNRVSTTTA